MKEWVLKELVDLYSLHLHIVDKKEQHNRVQPEKHQCQ